ncbi:phytoene dehydrogenase-like oxidoreductase [Methanolobus tindarius DSM 2278]|uniref:Phytoene dehydrogenase-like oxidoreductase n=1 Tax=Methanolobus tindarius DSM 2278 TaxID=1090322 RepID=W9DN03_METTI|nr:NAD(P)/FAD-dependent oxidoreductase [Methanolobus tindarius]ETA67259.1 phytoene dehydrogenase-like oxidoreductase [Methanolobus tindarius DSM 2278]
MKAIIIGSGLGGLLSAAKLSKEGYEVEIFERLPIIGGRFTNIPYQGFQLSTGALHMIPHGPAGPLSQLLKDVGADVEIVRKKPVSVIRVPRTRKDTDYKYGHKDILFEDFKVPFSLLNRLKLIYYVISTRKNPPTSQSFEEWCRKHIPQDWTYRISDSFFGWALSLKGADVPVEEAFAIIENLYHFGGPGVPMGGCKGVTDALVEIITTNGGTIHTSSEVSGFKLDNDKVTTVIVDGEEHAADLVISDIGHPSTAKMIGTETNISGMDEYSRKSKDLKPSAGIKICLSSDKPLIGHGGVLLTPYAKRVNGINEVTNVDPSLAPAGKHLTMAHQCVHWNDLNELDKEIELGLEDLKDIFAGKEYEVLLIQSYSNDWPVNRSPSGADLKNKTPVSNLYVVGDGAKGKGGIEVEGIALGVKNCMQDILIT